MKTTTQIIAKEGFAAVLLCGAFTIAFYALCLYVFSAVALLFSAITIIFFRNTERIPDERDSGVFIAPIDGEISLVLRTENSVVVEVRNSFLNPHLIRSPIQSKKISLTKCGGLFGSFKESLSYLAQRETLKIGKVRLTLFPSLKPSRIYADKGAVFLGERIAFFYGGRAELELPLKTELRIGLGSRVYAGESIIGFARSA
ncbi:MAG: hypothetical protein LBT81_01410 [Helicobacteraceae bacterium]|jgi:phosphatidylserine decarboxylase|nr:hypothetical protein [Helicobacteraceae bacterium]